MNFMGLFKKLTIAQEAEKKAKRIFQIEQDRERKRKLGELTNQKLYELRDKELRNEALKVCQKCDKHFKCEILDILKCPRLKEL